MTHADIAVQIKLLILFTVGLITLLTFIIRHYRQDHRIDLKTTLPLILVALFMAGVLFNLALL
ncbi:hypothetical protein FD04_GL002470 [Secundilactobacillus odoratitofui DSM 19909 = JCM 15043]|uniref:Uncharacterized protein n=1 Tax=Secundilactobacillus odoratitofui DSM 19909 = JCM 15043 TaxID=1423776 RepID=A0A0R1LVP7_9LACO|nr:hypothetical protein [Secundilactobacillus odoratitofui]KRK99693.1 hypothetical protein FD04_GL002470 [Secundilactobacillus odoratitofui DSM 19909 = JCM 15043]